MKGDPMGYSSMMEADMVHDTTTGSKVIGIDLGGTNIKAALLDAKTGECEAKLTALTRDGAVEQGRPAFVAEAEKLIQQLERDAGERIGKIGISAPGLANPNGRRIEWMPGRMHGLAGLDWPEALGRDAQVLNDAQAALLGEVWQGAARGARQVVMLTLGTGVGGAVMCDGRLLRGRLGRAGHLGHITVDAAGPGDIVKTPGSLEDAVGNATLGRRSGGRFTMTRDLLKAVGEGDDEARGIWEVSMRALAAGLASIINMADPEVVVLGGGIAAGGRKFIEEPLARWLDVFEWRPGGNRVRIEFATLGEWAGAIGAGWAALGGGL